MHTQNSYAGVISRLIDENYVDIDSVISLHVERTCRGDTNTMLETLAYINDVAPINRTTHIVTLENKKLIATDPEKELSATFPLPVRIPLRIGYNIQLLLKIFKAIQAERFTWSFNGPLSASMIKPIGTKEQYLIMPVRIPDVPTES